MENNQERLQKYMAECGVASRRKCEELITSGKVTVNGVVVTELGTKVSKKDVVYVNGKLLAKEEFVYYLLNKPTGYVTTTKDEKNRKTVLDLILPEHLDKRIFPVGRLDYETSGALILTNDGELANRLLNSSNNVEKEYIARIEGMLTIDQIAKLMRGVEIDGVMTKRATVTVESTDKEKNSSSVRLLITEGRNHQVRKMFEKVGHPVKKLKRVKFAGISIEDMGVGDYRALKIHEIKQLYSK